jgi:hypothetical protein
LRAPAVPRRNVDAIGATLAEQQSRHERLG